MIRLKETCPEGVKDFFNFVIENNIDEYHTLSEIRGKLEGQSFDIIELKNFSFYDINNFDCEHNQEMFTFICTLARSKEEYHLMLYPEKDLSKFGKLERQVSPPLEAYKYIPHNKMDIKDSGRSYGLLFE